MVAHLAGDAPLLGHRLVKLLTRLVEYLGPLGCFPVTTPGATAVIVAAIATLDVFRALLLVPFRLSQRDGR